jgi:DNA polymerase III subunit delta
MSQPSGRVTAAARDQPRLDAPVYVVRGGEEVIVDAAVRDLVRALLAGDDPSLALEEVAADRLHPPDTEAPSLRPLVDAAQTPPFLADRRVVVGRDLNLFTRADQLQPLIDYLADPLPTTSLVLAWSSGRVPKNLLDAVARCGGEDIDTSPGRQLAPWVDEQLRKAGLRLDRASRQRIVEWLGDDPQRLVGLVQTLSGAYGGTAPGAAELSPDDIEPYLGEAGGVPPWELTDAIDKGDVRGALERLQRMLRGGERHPLQVMATLHNHYGRMLSLDGAPVRGEKEAAQLLGIKGSTFPAKKALAQTRKLGHERIVRALDLLSAADLDLRGGKAWPDDLVLEVLVARLAQLNR